MEGLTIGELGAKAQVNIETLRYYERRGLLPLPPRSPGNYRLYPPGAVDVVRFIKRAKELGFTLKEIEEILSLRALPEAQCADARELAQAKIGEVDRKIEALQSIRQALSALLTGCPGESSIENCPILKSMDAEGEV